MQDYSNPYATPYSVAAQSVDVRAQFIRKTYAHLAGAIAVFALIEYLILQIPGIDTKVMSILNASPYSWLLVLGGFMGISMLANKWAMSNTSKSTQYLGLGLYVVAEAIIFLPMIIMATMYTDAGFTSFGGINILGAAGIITLAMTAGISLIAFTTKKDFSFLSGFLKIGGLVAIAVIVLSIIMGFTLGLLFSAAMVIFASVSILYQTSNIIHHYNTNQYVAASLGLFASVALLFWYVLRILMSFTSSD